MIKKSIYDSEELANELSKYKKGFVFRGQTKHYLSEDGTASLRPSFWVNGGPDGCIPPLRAAWVNFAHFALYALTGDYDIHHHRTEAILQHYGWKSFFLDVTKSPAVAAWFASHTFNENPRICMTEDSQEQPVWLRAKEASFEAIPSENYGHIYVIPLEFLGNDDLEFLDLSFIQTERLKSRPEVQKAGLIGPFNPAPLPEEHIAAHLTVPTSVLREFAKKAGFDNIGSIFPSPSDDPVYDALLSAPWQKLIIEDGMKIPVFARLLEIPDYYWSCPRRLLGNDILYDGTAIETISSDGTGPFANAQFYPVRETTFYFQEHNADVKFQKIRRMLSKSDMVVFELPHVWRRPDIEYNGDLSKGLVIKAVEEDKICLMELTVNWQERNLVGFGCEMGLHYIFSDDDRLTRFAHTEDCPCNNNGRHRFHFEALSRIEQDLMNTNVD